MLNGKIDIINSSILMLLRLTRAVSKVGRLHSIYLLMLVKN